MKAWQRKQWAAAVAVLVLIVLVLLVAWPRPSDTADRVVVRITDGGTPVTTAVVPLH